VDIFYRVDIHDSGAGRPANQSVLRCGTRRTGSNPVLHVVPVSALSIQTEIGPGIVNMLHPVVSDKVWNDKKLISHYPGELKVVIRDKTRALTHICVTHDSLSQHFGAMICESESTPIIA
jgi:hypothetical protein